MASCLRRAGTSGPCTPAEPAAPWLFPLGPDGSYVIKNIEDIREGDLLLARDQSSNTNDANGIRVSALVEVDATADGSALGEVFLVSQPADMFGEVADQGFESYLLSTLGA